MFNNKQFEAKKVTMQILAETLGRFVDQTDPRSDEAGRGAST